MDVAEWQKRLEDNFPINGVIGGNLREIISLEQAYGEYFVGTFHGQSVLIDSFQSFYIETLKNAFQWVEDHGWPKGCENYAPILLYYVIIFRRFRACENLMLKGYPFDGYALLRDLKDRAILLAGIVTNITTLPSLFGQGAAEVLTEEEWVKAKERSKTEEQRVLSRIIRKGSGLAPDIIKELGRWEWIFHQEVHGSKLSFFTELGEWVKGTGAPSIGPTRNQKALTIILTPLKSRQGL